jgi:hypothetical protein
MKYKIQRNSLVDFLFKGLLLVVLLFLGSCNKLGKEEVLISFNRDVRPILNDKCLRCHGGVKANGGFSMLFEEEAFGKTQSGKKAIVRGNHKKSELFKRLVHKDPDIRMPLEANPLSANQIEIIKNWIDQGAKWEKHWAYIPPNESVIPPEVNDQNWSKNVIDQFIFKKLTEQGFTPASETDKHTLIRRVTLDLTGLPPTMEEVQDFVSDNAPKAYENLVDTLLASPHFGERWATMWLDLARYADSKGYEKDTNREIWKYRDWVINAFNNDMPFDQFSIEQLAGDLVKEPTEEQLIATAFHRNTLANDEGGTDNEQFRTESVLERVATTYEVWQGTTMACVQCHSHPYDPFKHEEFYESMAFFNNAVDNDSYFEQPKLFTYSETNEIKVEELLQYFDKELLPEDKYDTKSPYLYTQKEALLTHLGHRFVEAETFDEASPFIEFDGGLNFLWQVQDSSWVKYEDIDLKNIEKIGFSISSSMDYAGEISVRLDSLGGKEIGRVKITNTKKSKEIVHGQKMAEFIASIEPVDERHDLFLQFYKGERYLGHLFYVDNLFYYEKEPLKEKYSTEFNKKVLELAKTPTTTTPIIQELQGEKARKTFVFDRGSWLSPGKEVSRGIPDIYDISKVEEPSNRLEFAQWLVSDKNPLASRVAVNRFWEQLFGFGLVESMEEFGSQGEKPTHPELLDWMSIRFSKDYGWKIKPFLKEVVLSATYRQSSKVSKEKIAQDPTNKWLARMGRTRLTGEQIRDQTLTVSGLLNKKIGGPSVKNADVDDTGGWFYIPDYVVEGDSAKYRRSLYTFWKRVNPPMNLIAFDSPDRSVCSSRRIRTNTPLQALNSLNDETFFEASQALADKMLKGGEQLEDRIKMGYYSVMGKEIKEKKLVLLVQLYNETYQHYFENKNSNDFPAIALEKKGKDKFIISALTVVANTLLNLDEFIVKG